MGSKKKKKTSGDSGGGFDGIESAEKQANPRKIETVKIEGDAEDARRYAERTFSGTEEAAEYLTEALRKDRESGRTTSLEGYEVDPGADAELRDALAEHAEGEPEDYASEDEGESGDEEGPERWHEFDEEELEIPVKLKVQGEEVEVPLREALQGYQRQADYTRKTQELKAQREEAANVRDEATRMAETYRQQLDVLGRFVGQNLDPTTRQVLAQSYERAVADAQAAQAHALQETLEREHEALTEALDWDSPESVEEGKTYLAEGAQEVYGFEPEVLSQLTDHRALVVLHDALRYREMREKADGTLAAARKGRKGSGRTLTPGTRNPSDGSRRTRATKELQARRERLRRTNRLDDAAAVIEGLLATGGE